MEKVILVLLAAAFCHGETPLGGSTQPISLGTQTTGEVTTVTSGDDDAEGEIIMEDRSNMTQQVHLASVYTEAVGRSGKIRVSSSPDFGPDDTVVIELDSMMEVGRAKRRGQGSKGGDDLVELKGGRHSFSTFANQNFMFSPLENVTYGENNISAQSFTFNSTLRKRIQGVDTQIAVVTLEVFIFLEAGDFSVQGERSSVKAGSVKFNIRVDDYQFCADGDASCSGNIGEALDVTVSVKGKGGAKAQKAEKRQGEDVEVFSLGGGSALRMSRKVQLDDSWSDMAEGFPELSSKGSKQLIRCRFPVFTASALYDPQVDLSLDGVVVDGGDNTNSASSLSALSFIFILISFLL